MTAAVTAAIAPTTSIMGPSATVIVVPSAALATAATFVTAIYAVIASVTAPTPTTIPVNTAAMAGCSLISFVKPSVISAIPFWNWLITGFRSSPMAIDRLLKLFSILSVLKAVVFVIASYAAWVVPAEFASFSRLELKVSSP